MKKICVILRSVFATKNPNRFFTTLRFVQNDGGGRRGFSLIELVMTIVVTSIIAIQLSLLLVQHIQSAFLSEDYTMAVELGRYDMERVNKITNWGNIVSANYSQYNYDITRTVTIIASTPPERLKRIQVDLRETGSAAVIVTFITYIAQNVIYGI